MKTSLTKRMLAMLLVLCMVIPMLPAITLPAKAAAEDPVVVVAGSDFQANTNALSAQNVQSLLTSIKENGKYDTVDGFLFAGDYSNGWTESYVESGVAALKEAVNGVYPGLADTNAVYVQGNHDTVYDQLTPSGANDTDDYGVFVINEDDFQWSAYSTEDNTRPTANSLRSYLNNKISRGYTKPIFVVSHVPLHYTMRTRQAGDSMYGDLLFEVLYEAADAGLNIIFMYGHNHSGSWEDSHGGTSVFYTKGDTINVAQSSKTELKEETLNFTYMNAGYVGYYTALNDGVDTTLNMSVFEITGDEVTITRYDAEGVHDLKSAGVANTGYTTYTESDYFQPDTTVTGSPVTVKLNKTIDTTKISGVKVESDGVTDVDVICTMPDRPVGFRYYMTYDITAIGYTQGNTATVSVPVENGIDQSLPVFVIDHENNATIPAQISGGNVVFTTNHFSLYSVAQMEQTTVVAYKKDTIGKRLVTVLTGEGMQQNIPYIITEGTAEGNYQWMLTGTAATKSGAGTGLLLEDYGDANTSHVWYFDGTYLRYGSADGPYLLLNSGNVTLSDTLDTAAAAVPVQLANSRRHNFQRADGTDVYLNRHGGGTSDNVALTYSASSYSRWYVHKVVSGVKASVCITASQTVMPMDGSIQLVPSAIVDYSEATPAQNLQEEVSDVTVTWTSMDSSIATVDENGLVTPVAPGQVYIRARLDSVSGLAATAGRSFADILITVMEVESTDTQITASTYYGQHMGEHSFAEVGNTYIAKFFNAPNWYYNGNTMLTTSEHYNGLNGVQGLELTPYPPLYSGAWYYDGTNLIHEAASNTDQYMVWDGSKITTGPKNGTNVPVMVDKENGYPLYPYLIASSDRTEGAKRLNHYGGYPYNVVGLYNGSNHVTFYKVALPHQEVTLTVSPAENLLVLGTTLNLTEKVVAGGVRKSDYTIQWASSDTSVVTVDDQGSIKAVGLGKTVVIAALTHLDGVELSAPLYLDVPVEVAEIPEKARTSGQTEPFLVLVTKPQAGVAYYVTSNAASNYDWVLTNTIKSAQLDASYSGPQLVPFDEGGSEHVWYYVTETDADGNAKQYLRYGNLTDENNYLIVDPTNNHVATLGSKSDTAYDQWEVASDGAYTPFCTSLSRYLNQHGGPGYDTAVSTSSYGSHAASRWRFNLWQDSVDYTFAITPDHEQINLSETLQLERDLVFDGVRKNTGNYTVKYTSSDPTVAAVTSKGEVIPKKAGKITVKATLVSVYHNNTTFDLADEDIAVYTTVTVHGISSVTVNNTEGYLPVNASHSLKINAMSAELPTPTMTVTYSDGSTFETALIANYLRTADGESVSTNEVGTQSGLKIVYKGVTCADSFQLNILRSELPDYPEYPNEGAVFINKTASGMDFQSSGVAQVELSVSGIPVKKGADVIIMLDTSSSMNGTVEGSSDIRINVLCQSLNNLLNDFQGTLEDGSSMDIRVAIADFNGNYNDDGGPYYLSPDDHLQNGAYRFNQGYGGVFTGDKTISASAFMDVQELGKNPFTTAYSYTGDTTGKYKLTYHSGTNYDYAFDVVYELGEAINDANAVAGEDRDLFVIFMSDGCPFQFNYFSSYSSSVNWNNWVTGTLDELDYDPYPENANRTYYNPEGKHWMAEAIKGDPKKEYPVIRKNDYRDEDGDTWLDVAGLGAKLYSIGFCLADDNKIPVSTMTSVLEKIATPAEGSSSYCHFAVTADELDTAFSAISGDIMYAASDAYFEDTMGTEYDLQLGHPTYQLNGVSKTFTDNKIQVRNYEIYTVADMDKGNCVESQLGVRKTDAAGNPIYTVSETVTFNGAGTEAYSDKIFVTAADGTVTYPNILVDGVICANSFWYNTTGTEKAITLSNGTTRALPAETFYWKIGRIQTVETALNYFVYLTRARGENGGRIAGIYPTNTEATLYYTNYLGNACHLVAPVPKMPWGQAQVSYGFYLVDKTGKPIVNEQGQTGSFEKSVRVGTVTSRGFTTNNSVSLVADELLPRALAETYRLFDSAARYDVSLNSDGYGTIAVYTNGIVPVSTYITGLTTAAFKDGDELGTQKPSTGFATANTTVWFALVVADDTIIVDKTVDSVAGETDKFTLTLDAYSTGSTVKMASNKPSDIVLVLDQSSTMYTPVGVDADRISMSNLSTVRADLADYAITDFETRVNAGDQELLDNAKHLGYYIAIHKNANYIYIVQYAQNDAGEWGWYYVPVDQTVRTVEVDTENTTNDTTVALQMGYDSTSGTYQPYGYGTYSQTNNALLPTSLVTYYQSQYGALYDTLQQFVTDLKEEAEFTGLDHRVAVVGFASPFYDGWTGYDGTGIYVDGNYHLFDSDYKYVLNGSIYDPDKVFGGDVDDYSSSNILASGSDKFHDYNVSAQTYADALVSVKDNYDSVLNSVKAYKANYQQTCPSIGISIAQSIFAARESTENLFTDPDMSSKLNPGSPTYSNGGNTYDEDQDDEHLKSTYTADNAEDRDEIIILFTDGVPTVRCSSDRDLGQSAHKAVAAEFWTIPAGIDDVIDHAYEAKQAGIQIYGIGTSHAVMTQYGAQFFEHVSSDDPSAQSQLTITENWVKDSAGAYFLNSAAASTAISNSTYSDLGYTMYTSDENMDLGKAFDTVYASIVDTVALDETAVLKEVLSDYFDLDNLTEAELLSNISVYTADYRGMDENGNDIFSETLVPFEDAVVEITKSADGRYDTISVKNFDYSTEYVSVYDGQPRGRKLVVKVEIQAREGFWGGNNVPTNDAATAIYTPDGEPFVYFPEPQANVPMQPELLTKDKTVYYGGSVDSMELVDKILVGGLEVDISDTGVLTPRQDWMDDYATLTWTPELTGPESLISGKDATSYDYGVTLTPIFDGLVNTSTLPSNMAGSPVTAASATDTANVFVLEPVITWKDMVIDLGTLVNADFCNENDFVSLTWVDQDTRATPDALPENAPTLTYRYSYQGKPLQDVPVDVHVTSSYAGEDITHVVTYLWQDCDQPIHKTQRDQIFEHSGSDISYEFYIHVSGEDALVSNKKAQTVPGKTDEFILNMEGYVTGSIEQITVTKPADIVLVLDHSASMHTPVGATTILKSPNESYAGEVYTGAGSMTKAELDTTKGAHRGYYVAQSTSSKWWFLMEYDAATDKWIGYSIPSTESIVDTGEGNYTEHTKTQTWSYANLPSQLVYYKTQYGVLYDSVLSFVEDLRASGVEHAVSIVGFAGSETSGTRLYVGGDEDTVKSYRNALYHVNTTDARRTELYRKAMKNVQDDTQYAALLANIEAIETNSSFTCPAAGIRLANELYNANELDRNGRDRIMILFTDGIPNRGIGEDDTTSLTQTQIYDEIVKEAAEAKLTYGTTVYSVSTTTLGTNADRTFLSYASSDYPNATGYATPGAPIEFQRYTMQVDGIDDMGIVFDTVTQDVSGTDVKLDTTAVLTDTVTKYFDLVGDEADVEVFTQRYLGNNQWAEEVPFANANVTISASASGRMDTISVTGFDYSKEYISEDGRTQTYYDADGNPVTTTDYRGSKLVVKVRVKTRDGFWGGNNIPTNENTAGIYGQGNQELSKFPEPQVNVPVKPLITAKDQTVYYGEDQLDALDHLVDSITVDGKEVTYDKTTGSFTPLEDWMDDFADMSWDPTGDTPETPISGTKADDYTFGVVLTPKTDGTTNTIPDNGGNIVGDPVSSTDGVVSDKSTGSVDVLVPVVSFEDSTITLGDATSKDYYELVNRDPDVQWVNQQDPYGEQGLTTTPSQGFTTQPTLDYTYSTDGTFTQDTPVNVEVSLDGTVITDEVYFDWTDCDSKLHGDEETIADDKTGDSLHRHQGSTDSFEFYVHVTCLLQSDAVVIDFGLPVDIDATFNDVLPEGAQFLGVKAGDAATALYATGADAAMGDTAKATHGTMTVTDGKLRFTPSGMKMNVSEVFSYEVSYRTTDAFGNTETRYYQSTVTVIPATIIYYEDNFLTFSTEVKQEDGSYKVVSGGWTTAGEEITAAQQQDRPGDALSTIDANNIYGTDSAYKNMSQLSLGSAQMIKVRDGLAGIASFSFKGTGFDLISLSSDDTGVVLVSVTDKNGKSVVNYMVDTYYGYALNYYKVTYTYGPSGWTKSSEAITREQMGQSQLRPENPSQGEQFVVYESRFEPNADASATLYQVPAIKVDLNEVAIKDDPNTTEVESGFYGYGEYNVEIYVGYGWIFDHGQCECPASENCTGCFDFYVDAIRIYDPANDGAEDAVVEKAYKDDNEYLPTYEELRNHLIDAGTFSTLTDQADGIIFIDSNTALNDDNASGVPGQIVDGGTSAVADYANYGPNNELYLTAGQAVAFQLNSVENINKLHLALKSVGGSAEATVYGIKDGKTTYVLDKASIDTATDLYHDITDLIGATVVIRNSGTAGMLSITNLKTTYLSNSGKTGGLFSISPASAALALASINEGTPVPVVPDGEDCIQLQYASVTFEDELKLNIYFGLKDIEAQELGLITFTSEVENGSLDNADAVIPGAVLMGSSYFASTQGIAAMNLVDQVWFRVYAKLADGTVLYSKLRSYSPAQYAHTVFGSDDYSAELKALTASMLLYGAEAQKLFGYRTEALITDGFEAQYLALAGTYSSDLFAGIRAVDASKVGAFAASEGAFSRKYPNVGFEGAFTIGYFMTPAKACNAAPVLYYWTQEAYDTAETLTAENASGVLTMTGAGEYSATVNGIAPKDMNSTVYAAVVYQSDGATYCSGVLAYSLGAYFQSQAAAPGEMQPLAQAAAVYGSRAEACFN